MIVIEVLNCFTAVLTSIQLKKGDIFVNSHIS